MRIVLKILAGLVAIVVVLAAVGFFLPRDVSVARSVTIDAPPEAIFPYVNSLQETPKWSPWLDRDPETVVTYEGPEAGVGNAMAWTSEHPQVGSGKQVIVASAENQRVDMDLDFGGMGTAKAYLLLDPQGAATEVTWGFATDMGMSPVGRWMGLMMDKWVGGDYENGLQRLKALVEAG